MNKNKKRNLHLLSFVLTYVELIAQLLKDLKSQYRLFFLAEGNLEALDTNIINYTQTTCKENSKTILFYLEQLNQRNQESQGMTQRQLLGDLAHKLFKIRELNTELFDLAKHLKQKLLLTKPREKPSRAWLRFLIG